MGKEILLNLFTGLPVRKNFALKPQLDWVVFQLQAGGFWHKWNDEQFIPQVCKIGNCIFITLFLDFSKIQTRQPMGSFESGSTILCILSPVPGPVWCYYYADGRMYSTVFSKMIDARTQMIRASIYFSSDIKSNMFFIPRYAFDLLISIFTKTILSGIYVLQ